MTDRDSVERFDTIVVGGGQAGLAVGYYLAEQRRNFVILDAGDRVGDTWRGRWDSLRLFTPARYDGLPGMPFPAPGSYYPTKDEMADYLEAYVDRFALPVRSGVRVGSLTREGRYLLASSAGRFEAEKVVVVSALSSGPRSPRLRQTSTRPSPNCTPALTGTQINSPRATSSWSGRATLEPRSPWS